MKAPDLRGEAGRTWPQGSEAVGTVASAHLQGSLKMLLPVCGLCSHGLWLWFLSFITQGELFRECVYLCVCGSECEAVQLCARM